MVHTLEKYQIFFTLRDKYPKHKELIAALMSFTFQNHDSFSKMTYLKGSFKEEDIAFIFEKLNIPIVDVIPCNLRGNHDTIVKLNRDIDVEEFSKKVLL